MSLRKLNRAMRPGTAKRRKRFYRKEFRTAGEAIGPQDYWTWQATMRGYFGAQEAIVAINKATRAGLRVPNRKTEGD